MTITTDDLRSFLDLLAASPEERGRLALLVYDDETLAAVRRLPATVAALAEAQRQSEARLARVEAAVRDLAEAQRRTDETVQKLVEAQIRAEERLTRLESTVQKLVEAQVRNEERFARLESTVEKLVDVVADMCGDTMLIRYRDHMGGYFGPLVRRPRQVAVATIEDLLEAGAPDADADEVMRLDLVISGRPRLRDDLGDVWLAVEVSSVIDRNDVDRAARRAAILRSAGQATVPVVAGERATEGAAEQAVHDRVAMLVGGIAHHWPEALAAATAG